ncbi:hypothetical protein [Parvibacter caecicola]|uniref:Uncharacterized protein n=1 Tax=Parvibacter caecicola TaxID=747645 RepID=A0A7W5D2E5_9ACTN|nr:hypothetical protein [Parvibacter caecicola]MBB3171433.1 hypothetical protein [Parvibacter caecicola]MCR2042253.1 hypothetical protein [Parvibacter caecicola]RNL11193.1 hypothetical protein DMP11_04820 [Parvibacter caecicola]
MGLRLTKAVRQQLLDDNDGFTTSTYYEGKNFREQRDYSIEGGELHIRARGKTSWADSRFDDEWVADEEETHHFLYRHLHEIQIPKE